MKREDGSVVWEHEMATGEIRQDKKREGRKDDRRGKIFEKEKTEH
jgi:hypothetical protein